MKTTNAPIQPVAPVVPMSDLGAMTREVRERLDASWHELTERSSFVGGPLVERFEAEWASYCGTAHAVGVANGTEAIELVLRALGIGGGDEVIVPANTFIATAEAVVAAGATPTFVDVDPQTLLVTPEAIRPAINARTAAIVAVGLWGNMPPMDEIARLAQVSHLALIEDAAQAHGSTWRGRKAGSFGVAGCFSFYPGKNLGAFGDGGAVVTGDPVLAERVRSLGNHGRQAGAGHVHALIGRNSRLDALQACVLSAKLERLDDWNQARRRIAARYRRSLGPEVETVHIAGDAVCTYHQHVVRIRQRDAIRAGLRRRGVESGIHYPIPCHRQEPYAALCREALPVVEQAAAEILSLPIFPHMTDWEVDYVSGCLRELMELSHATTD
jgi:dTDP-4-amino-4,6-dideoxygalactose transaminase